MGEDEAAVAHEFFDVLNDIAGTHAMSVMGVIRMIDVLTPHVEGAPSPDSLLFIGHGDPNSAEALSWQRWKMNTVLDRLDADGPVIRDLGQQWLVMVASQWNDHYRKRLARAAGVDENEIRDARMADVNRMRNDVIHHRGIATTRNTGRCEVLRWFEPGSPIHVMPVHVAEFMHHVGLVHGTTEIDGGGPWTERGGV